MKTPIKTMATILLASTSAKAMDQVVLISSTEIKMFETQNKLAGVSERLMSAGILLPSNRKGIFVLNDARLSQLSDDEIIPVVSGIVKWVTDNKIQLDKKELEKMGLSSQDYKAINRIRE